MVKVLSEGFASAWRLLLFFERPMRPYRWVGPHLCNWARVNQHATSAQPQPGPGDVKSFFAGISLRNTLMPASHCRDIALRKTPIPPRQTHYKVSSSRNGGRCRATSVSLQRHRKRNRTPLASKRVHHDQVWDGSFGTVFRFARHLGGTRSASLFSCRGHRNSAGPRRGIKLLAKIS